VTKFDPALILARCNPDVRPRWDDIIPRCTDDDLPRCPLWDGKRCAATGSRPESICEPMVEEVTMLLDQRIRANLQRNRERP
jgi:hypothetical protein